MTGRAASFNWPSLPPRGGAVKVGQGVVQPSLFDAKETGQRSAIATAGDAWTDAALTVVREMAGEHCEFSSDDVRVRALQRGIGEPGQPNAWGAVVTVAAKQGWIRNTGRTVVSSRLKARARRLCVWVGVR